MHEQPTTTSAYNLLEKEKTEKGLDNSEVFRTRLSDILSRELTPSQIDSYAENALIDLIDLVDDVVNTHKLQTGIEANTSSESENIAFDYYNLGSIESTLDHVAGLSNKIEHLNTYIEHMPVSATEYVQPDYSPVEIIPGSGTFEEAEHIPRLKTLLFILQNDFNIDINNPEEIDCKKGSISKSRFRHTPYSYVHIPSLNRIILVNDESGNRTFVFDTQVMSDHNISREGLSSLHKDNLKIKINEIENLGTHFIYKEDSFMTELSNALSNQLDGTKYEPETKPSSYLVGNAPDGYMSVKSLSQQGDSGAGISYYNKKLNEIRDELGPISFYRFGSRVAEGLSPEQQLKLSDYVKSSKLSIGLPEGYKSLKSLRSELNMSRSSIIKRLEELKDEIGPIATMVHTNGKAAAALSPEQQEILAGSLVELSKRPEDHSTINELAIRLGVDRSVIRRAIKSQSDKIGDITLFQYEKKGKPVLGISPAQQNIIAKEVEFEKEKKTYKSQFMISKISGYGRHLVKRVVEELEQEGELGQVVTRGAANDLYNAYQTSLILDALKSVKR